jgi:hypothetical protein
MLNFPFYNKHINHLVLDKNLRDYIKKSNTDSFNKFAEKQQEQQYKKTNPNSSNSLLHASLITPSVKENETNSFSFTDKSPTERNSGDALRPNFLSFRCNYRNYSDTFTSNQTCDCDLENEDYLCNFCDLNDDCDIEFNNKNSKSNSANSAKTTIAKKMYFLIGVAGAFITIGTGITFIYYKKFNFTKNN